MPDRSALESVAYWLIATVIFTLGFTLTWIVWAWVAG